MNSQRTEGELLFEQYLTSVGVPFDFERSSIGKSARPDYTCEWNGKLHIFDVKDFVAPPYIGAGAYDRYESIRTKIGEGRKKFKEYKEYCCALVLYNQGHPLVELHDADVVQGAMFGNTGISIPVDTNTGVGDSDAGQRAFISGGKMVAPHSSIPQNTTISAVVTLTTIQPGFDILLDMAQNNPNRDIGDCREELLRRIPHYDDVTQYPRVIVWHNLVARIPFPLTLFNGPYDSHIGLASVDRSTVKREILFRGERLPATRDY